MTWSTRSAAERKGDRYISTDGGELVMNVGGSKNRMQVTEVREFSTTKPYALVEMRSDMIQPAEKVKIHGRIEGGKWKVTKTANGKIALGHGIGFAVSAQKGRHQQGATAKRLGAANGRNSDV